MDACPLCDTLRKCKNRENETSDQRELRQKYDRERKYVKRCSINHNKRKNRQHEAQLHIINEQPNAPLHIINDQPNALHHITDDHYFPNSDLNLLHKFRSKIDKFANNLCTVCNECFPSIKIVCGECRRCHSENKELKRLKLNPELKKFSSRNNMDLGDVPEELQGLTQIEEMLIAQIFPIISVYYLRSGQYTYQDNVINFPQDIKEFATHLPHRPLSLDVLVVRHHSSDGRAFKDFNVRHSVVSCALHWLKHNNQYYSNIVIDEEVLGSLPDNGLLDDQIPQLEDISDEIADDADDSVVNNFVPILFLTFNENTAINDTLIRLQAETELVLWPNIDGVLVNEFRTPGYIAHTFLTLYPTGAANLHSERARDVKLAEYFSHLLKYKDGQFTHHTHWRYFALNLQMPCKRANAIDFHWPDLHSPMPHENSPSTLSEQEATAYRRQDLIDNPHITAWFFERRFELFFEKVLIPKWNLEDCASYCLHIDHTGQQSCRFGYLKEIGKNTYIRDDNGQPELITARNDQLINPYNHLQLQGWHVNVDLKPILSIKVALNYVAKYVSKSEPRSTTFSDMLTRIVNNSDPSDSSLSAVQRLLLQTVVKHDISAQETCHLLLGLPLYRSSHQFVSLNLNKDVLSGFIDQDHHPFHQMKKSVRLCYFLCKNIGIAR
ncbi:hypothetical protein RclHR1_05150004 [Rhizophagus clarus]|uniref:DUF6570 domain-containing protein n=1 Tax=Rhizophagus clarus TaxID=94130 RepID=A0A2Z6RM60_9GLOM|nr:hypothetical protein RclHR1_05150004 [Rhizophagus clarus]